MTELKVDKDTKLYDLTLRLDDLFPGEAVRIVVEDFKNDWIYLGKNQDRLFKLVPRQKESLEGK